MPMPGFMTIIGASQGEIDGSSESIECQSCIDILAIDHRVEIPTQARSGLSLGKAVHRPLTIIKPIDTSTPKLYQALCTLEPLDVTLSWYRPVSTTVANTECFYKVELEGARIVEINPVEHHVFDSAFDDYPLTERISFAYSLIRWTWEPKGIQYEQEWAAGTASSETP